MDKNREIKIWAGLVGVFLAVYFLPVGTGRFDSAIMESLELTKWYAREHVVLCLLPAFWIAGAIAAFVSQASVMRYLGAALSLPNMLVINSVIGPKKTGTYVALVVVMATLTGWIYGMIF